MIEVVYPNCNSTLHSLCMWLESQPDSADKEWIVGATDELAAVLGIDPAGLAVLETHDEQQVRQLTDGVRASIAQDDRIVEAGMNEALRFVPGLLRGTAKKLLFGGRG